MWPKSVYGDVQMGSFNINHTGGNKYTTSTTQEKYTTHPNGDDKHLPRALHNVSTGKKQWIHILPLFDVVGLSRKRTLVHFQVIALNNKAIGWEEITCNENGSGNY